MTLSANYFADRVIESKENIFSPYPARFREEADPARPHASGPYPVKYKRNRIRSRRAGRIAQLRSRQDIRDRDDKAVQYACYL